MAHSLLEALVTKDGYVTGMSDQRETHPVYGTDAYAMRLAVPLRPEEKWLMEEVREKGIGHVLWVIRSSLAQLEIDVFGGSVQVSPAQSDHVVVDTLATSLTEDHGYRVLDHMRRMLEGKRAPYVGRAAILPDAARLGYDEAQLNVETGDVRGNMLHVLPDGSIVMPLTRVEYRYGDDLFQPDTLENILGKHDKVSGRATIKDRRTLHARPKVLAPGQFFVGGVDIHSRLCHVILESTTRYTQHRESSGIHLSALCMDGGRTVNGDRQVEIRANGQQVDLERLWLRAKLYWAANAGAPGV